MELSLHCQEKLSLTAVMCTVALSMTCNKLYVCLEQREPRRGKNLCTQLPIETAELSEVDFSSATLSKVATGMLRDIQGMTVPIIISACFLDLSADLPH